MGTDDLEELRMTGLEMLGQLAIPAQGLNLKEYLSYLLTQNKPPQNLVALPHHYHSFTHGPSN